MIQAEVGKLRELNREILEEQARGQSLRMSACSWGEAQKADFENLYRDDRWSPSHVKNALYCCLASAGATTAYHGCFAEHGCGDRFAWRSSWVAQLGVCES